MASWFKHIGGVLVLGVELPVICSELSGQRIYD
jgi:hypothetical protein